MSRAQVKGQVWLRHLLGESMAHQMQSPQAIQDLQQSMQGNNNTNKDKAMHIKNDGCRPLKLHHLMQM